MKKKQKLYLLLSLVVGMIFMSGARGETTSAVEELYKNLTIDQKVGQLFIFGFHGKNYNRQLDKTIKDLSPGGFISFSHNISSPLQTVQLNRKIQSHAYNYSKLPILLMVDQEGGSVARIKTRPNAPSAQSLGETRNKWVAEDSGKIIGKLLHLLGFSMNLAPVVDLSNPLSKDFIGSRSFGDDPVFVSEMGSEFARGLESSGIIPTFKHFPGHGDLAADSHKRTPQKNLDLDHLMTRDLIPFRGAQRNSGSAVMVAHVALPKIDPSGLPASFSPLIINDLLRSRLGFQGLAITDDIEMGGAKFFKTVGERAIHAILAGNDMVMVAWSYKKQKEAYEAVRRAVLSGVIPQERFESAVKRVLSAKAKILDRGDFFTAPTQKEFLTQLRGSIRALKHLTTSLNKRKFEATLREKSFSDKQQKFLGQLSSAGKVFVFSSDQKFYRAFRQAYKKSNSNFVLLKKAQKMNMKQFGDLTSIHLYYVTGKGSARILNTASDEFKKRTIVVNGSSVGDLNQADKFLGVINLGTRNYLSGKWLGELMYQKRFSHRSPAGS